MKKSLKENNHQYWNNIGESYTSGWTSGSKGIMSQKELSFINLYLRRFKPQSILDIGIGNGRIIENHIKNSGKQTKIFGADVSEEMVKICKKKFEKEIKIIGIKKSDASDIDSCFRNKFDFVTSIRCIKYNKDWEKILKKIYKKLNSKGIFIFDITNKYSINFLYKSKIPQYRLSTEEIITSLNKIGFRILDMRTFNRLPDVLYDLSANKTYKKALKFTEKILSRVLGNTRLGKIVFISAIKE